MLPSRYRTTFLFVVLLTLTLTYLPMLVSSFPIVAFQDLSSHASKSNSSYIDDQVVFDVSPTFVLLIALLVTFVWIAFKMTIDLFISWVNRILAASIALAEEVVDQLSYFSLDTIFRVATSIVVDANDLRRDFTRPMGEPANPISTTAHFAPQSQRSPRVIPPGYGIRSIDISDRGPPPLRSTPPV